jgi:hypothetical protein
MLEYRSRKNRILRPLVRFRDWLMSAMEGSVRGHTNINTRHLQDPDKNDIHCNT